MTFELGLANEQIESSQLNHLLNAAEDAPPVAAVDAVAQELLVSVQALQVSFFIADFSGEQLVRLAQHGATDVLVDAETDTLAIEGSFAGTALRRQEVQVNETDSISWVYVPVTARGETVGVLQVVLPKASTPEVIAELRAVAHALAYIIIVNGRHTDLFEWGQRSIPMTLAAEIQRRLIPAAFTCEAGRFTLAGWLEPSSQVAGDTFDYSLERDELSVSMTDAMGHSVNAALLAVIAVSAIRNTRRIGEGVQARATAANDALRKYSGRDDFVTGLLMSIDLSDSMATFVNAGHPLPYLCRNGNVSQIQLEPDMPLGMFETDFRAHKLALLDGDRLILVTDGLIERTNDFVDLIPIIKTLSELHPREVVQRLCQRVATEAGGTLDDDSTVLCLDWHGGNPSRHTDSGANDEGATA